VATCGNDRFLFIHVPKTGGSWVSRALQAADIEVQEEFGPTAYHPLLSELDRRGRFTFAFVREPLSWYGSIWRFRNQHQFHKHPIHGGLPYDQFIDLDFPDFVAQVAEHLPGFLSNHYELFVGPPENEIDFIGRYENLEGDLVSGLRAAGQEFDEVALRSLAAINTTAPHPPCPEETRLRLMRSEGEAYERFYKSELATASRS
jgi:hypothetical protein